MVQSAYSFNFWPVPRRNHLADRTVPYFVILVQTQVLIDGGGHGRCQYRSQCLPVAVEVVLGHLAQRHPFVGLRFKTVVYPLVNASDRIVPRDCSAARCL